MCALSDHLGVYVWMLGWVGEQKGGGGGAKRGLTRDEGLIELLRYSFGVLFSSAW